IFISCWINHKKRKKLEGTLFGHPLFYYLIIYQALFFCSSCRCRTFFVFQHHISNRRSYEQ
uniref:hypothetical protein n=1 Tax=Bacteroides fragilis TaxID=817 RepID=UPI0035614509